MAQPPGYTANVLPGDYFVHFYRPDQWFDEVPTDVDLKEQDGDKIKRVLHTIAYNQGKETCLLELGTGPVVRGGKSERKKCLGCH